VIYHGFLKHSNYRKFSHKFTDDDCGLFERRGQHMSAILATKIGRKFKILRGGPWGPTLKTVDWGGFVKDRETMGQIWYLLRYLYKRLSHISPQVQDIVGHCTEFISDIRLTSDVITTD